MNIWSCGLIILKRPIKYSIKDVSAALAPLSASIDEVEIAIESIAERNNRVDDEMKIMKNDISSLSSKILVIRENINGTTTFGASCQEYFERGSRRNGIYSIRPDVSSYGIKTLYELYETFSKNLQTMKFFIS